MTEHLPGMQETLGSALERETVEASMMLICCHETLLLVADHQAKEVAFPWLLLGVPLRMQIAGNVSSSFCFRASPTPHLLPDSRPTCSTGYESCRLWPPHIPGAQQLSVMADS